MHRKGLVLFIGLALVLVFTMPAFAWDITTLPAEDAKVIVDGKQLNVSCVREMVSGGTTLFPLRTIFEALGASVDWDHPTYTVTATKSDTTIKLTMGSKTAYRNGQPIALVVPGFSINGTTMVPLRFVSESLGASVDWNKETQTITIVSDAISVPQTQALPVQTEE